LEDDYVNSLKRLPGLPKDQESVPISPQSPDIDGQKEMIKITSDTGIVKVGLIYCAFCDTPIDQTKMKEHLNLYCKSF
jgi:hypothetical protein